MWRHAQNVVSTRVLYKFYSTLVIYLKFVFIEILDKTYYIHIVCWYKTVYQVLSIVWTNRTIATRSDTGTHNRLDLIQSLVPTHYVCNGYLLYR
jgi:hypothetical protein